MVKLWRQRLQCLKAAQLRLEQQLQLEGSASMQLSSSTTFPFQNNHNDLSFLLGTPVQFSCGYRGLALPRDCW